MGNFFSKEEKVNSKQQEVGIGPKPELRYVLVGRSTICTRNNYYEAAQVTRTEKNKELNVSKEPENKYFVDHTLHTVSENKTQAELPNKSTAATLPPKFTTKDEFIATWFTWKNEFFAYLRSIDKTGDKKQMWGIMLLNRMGPVGQEIHRTFSFYDKNSEDINVLIKKFDLYYVYGDKKRGSDNLDEYINDLKFIASNYVNSIWIMKEKIIQDISTQRFTGKAALVIKSKGEDLIPYLQSLSLNNIILFWRQCDNLMTQKIEEIPKQNTSYAKSAVIECTRCGTQHNRNRCPAWGAQCTKCTQLNHFTNNCRVKYLDDCTRCGMSHIQLDVFCPAYGELCTKCGKKNHFSLKCQIPFVNNCKRCGMNHAVTMCPAQGRTCSRCNKPNHLEEHCASKFDDGL